ncbi:MAG TPA: hypothetical protein VGG19_12270 [Tepidisphaeraceae bacterium]|jgi:hypothetical protein
MTSSEYVQQRNESNRQREQKELREQGARLRKTLDDHNAKIQSEAPAARDIEISSQNRAAGQNNLSDYQKQGLTSAQAAYADSLKMPQ